MNSIVVESQPFEQEQYSLMPLKESSHLGTISVQSLPIGDDSPSCALASTSLFSRPSFKYLRTEDTFFLQFIKTHKQSRLPTIASLEPTKLHATIGSHVLAEFDASELALSSDKLRYIMSQAANHAGATVLSVNFYETACGRISGVVVIAESHLIAHYFPDGYLAIDIYTCGETIDPMNALRFVQTALGVKPYDVTSFKRGVKPKDYDHATTGDRFAYGVAEKTSAGSLRFFSSKNQSKPAPSTHASHFVVEMYFADPAITQDASRLSECFSNAFSHPFHAKITHAFEPIGVSGVSLVYIGDGIHVTTHPWPELAGYTPLDIFARKGSNINVSDVIRRVAAQLSTELGPVAYALYDFQRGVVKGGKLIPVFNQAVKRESPAPILPQRPFF